MVKAAEIVSHVLHRKLLIDLSNRAVPLQPFPPYPNVPIVLDLICFSFFECKFLAKNGFQPVRETKPLIIVNLIVVDI